MYASLDGRTAVRTAGLAGLDAAATAIPLTIGGTVILYGQVAPSWIPAGILAACLGLLLTHLLTATSHRPVPFAARFFEAVTLATMVQSLAGRLPDWQLANTPEVRVALMLAIMALSGGVVGLLWALRAERFVRFIPAPVYAGFSTSVAVALSLNQLGSMARQMSDAESAWMVPLLVAVVLGTALLLRRWRPRWPAAATALGVGALLYAGMAALGWGRLPLLADQVVWTLPLAMADVQGVGRAIANHLEIGALVAQHALILGILVFLNNVVIGQMLAQTDDRTQSRPRDRWIQSVVLAGTGALGCAPLSGSPTAAIAATRHGPLQPWTLAVIGGVSVLVYASGAVTWLPLAALTGVFLFDAWVLWDRPAARHAWAWLRRQTLATHAKEDLIVIGGVMAAALLINMVAGLTVGLVLGLLLHAYRNTSTPVRKIWDGTQMLSNCARSRSELRTLAEHGRALKVFTLDSHQFFVSAASLSQTIRQHLLGTEVAILDWSRVAHIDSSLALAIQRIETFAHQRGVTVLHAGADRRQSDVFSVLQPLLPRMHACPDLDRALEQGENILIQRYGDPAAALEDDEGRFEWPGGLNDAQQTRLMQCMTSHAFQPGEALVRSGDASTVMWLIATGSCSVMLSTAGGVQRRIAGIRSGTVVGEIGFLDGAPRSATVVADTPVHALSLDRGTFDRLALEEPEIVRHLLQRLALDLASRLRNSARYTSAQIDTVLA